MIWGMWLLEEVVHDGIIVEKFEESDEPHVLGGVFHRSLEEVLFDQGKGPLDSLPPN